MTPNEVHAAAPVGSERTIHTLTNGSRYVLDVTIVRIHGDFLYAEERHSGDAEHDFLTIPVGDITKVTP